MCNGGEGRTLKPCCDAALASSRYISNGPAKAHSLRCTGLPHPSYTLLFPSATESLFYRVLRVWPSSPPFSFFHSLFHSPAPLASTRATFVPRNGKLWSSLARARASVDDSCPRSPPSTFLGPESPCGGDAWAGGGIREALYKSPSYRLTRAHSFSPPLALSLPCLPSSLSLSFHLLSLILLFFFFFFLLLSFSFIPLRVSPSFFITPSLCLSFFLSFSVSFTIAKLYI